MKRKILPMLLALTLAVAIMSFAGCGQGNDTAAGDTVTYTVEVSEGKSNATATALTDVIEQLRQQVVDVYATASTGSYAGSGVIVGTSENKTYIITNHHVIESCYAFEVDVLNITADGVEKLTTYTASLIGSSPKDDIAVLRIDAGGLSAANWIDNSDKVKVGTEVIAIGNPLGVLGGTVTKGIISAKARAIEVDGIGVMTLMQTDAAINSGNSGGGLFSTDGLLIGIVNSGYTDYEGLNFAIPANDAKYVFGELTGSYAESAGGSVISYGCVKSRANIGLKLGYYKSLIYSSNSMSSASTYMLGVYSVNANSDSARAGVAANKAITSIVYDGVTYVYDSAKYYNNIYYYYLEMCTLVNSIGTGDELTLHCSDIKNGPSNRFQYISGSYLYKITATQYIYTPPSAI